MSATTTPINRVDCMRNPCATLDGAKPSCATASWTRALSGALTKLVALRTFETVAVDTRARRATSLIVGFGKVRLVVRSREREPEHLSIGRLSLRLFNEDQACGFTAGRRLAPCAQSQSPLYSYLSAVAVSPAFIVTISVNVVLSNLPPLMSLAADSMATSPSCFGSCAIRAWMAPFLSALTSALAAS